MFGLAAACVLASAGVASAQQQGPRELTVEVGEQETISADGVRSYSEGARGIAKTYDHRYQLTEFGLGFMRLALETNTPIVPVGIVGAEEQYVSVADVKPLAKLLGMPNFPLIPQLFLGMLAPLPVRYRLYFGEPLRFEGDPDDDDAVVEAKVATVRSSIEALIARGLKERPSVCG